LQQLAHMLMYSLIRHQAASISDDFAAIDRAPRARTTIRQV
jgi:hypothetical protein